MGDLIDRQAALKEVREAYENDEMFDGYEYRLNELPSTEIIHCQECKYVSYEPSEGYEDVYVCNRTVCTRMSGGNMPDHYCGYAERRE